MHAHMSVWVRCVLLEECVIVGRTRKQSGVCIYKCRHGLRATALCCVHMHAHHAHHAGCALAKYPSKYATPCCPLSPPPPRSCLTRTHTRTQENALLHSRLHKAEAVAHAALHSSMAGSSAAGPLQHAGGPGSSASSVLFRHRSPHVSHSLNAAPVPQLLASIDAQQPLAPSSTLHHLHHARPAPAGSARLTPPRQPSFSDGSPGGATFVGAAGGPGGGGTAGGNQAGDGASGGQPKPLPGQAPQQQLQAGLGPQVLGHMHHGTSPNLAHITQQMSARSLATGLRVSTTGKLLGHPAGPLPGAGGSEKGTPSGTHTAHPGRSSGPTPAQGGGLTTPGPLLQGPSAMSASFSATGFGGQGGAGVLSGGQGAGLAGPQGRLSHSVDSWEGGGGASPGLPAGEGEERGAVGESAAQLLQLFQARNAMARMRML